MPTYEYKCGNCGHEFEQFQSITARPLRRCPQCGRNALNRLIGTGAGVIFKGSGFYETDYRSESYKQAQKKETDKGKEKKDDKKSEVKTAETGESGPSAKSTSKKDKDKSAQT
jgi:putative FmdB family regulatory protein